MPAQAAIEHPGFPMRGRMCNFYGVKHIRAKVEGLQQQWEL